MNIYSRIDPTQLLHIIMRRKDVQPGRTDIIEADNKLQCAVMNMNKGVTFKPHKHNVVSFERIPMVVQESWVVLQGSVYVTLYDIDDTVLHTDVLEQGDISITVGQAGHNYLIMSDHTLVAEFKSGPYMGQSLDKIMI